MVRRGPILLVGLCACGRAGFDGVLDGPDGVDSAANAVELVLGENGGDTHAAVADTHIVFESADVTFGTCDFTTADGMDVNSRILIAFELSSVPPGARVEAAALELWIRSETTADIASSDSGLLAVRLLEAWEEGSACYVGGTPNWIERVSGITWLTMGAGPPSSDATVLGTARGPLPFDLPFTIALPPDLIRSWLDDPATNFGVAIFADTSDGATIHTREGPDGRRPRLRLTIVT